VGSAAIGRLVALSLAVVRALPPSVAPSALPNPGAAPDAACPAAWVTSPDVEARTGNGKGETPGDLGPLPGGHHGLSREQIADSQRERLLAAMAHEVAARGYRATTITEVVKLASVSTRDFYELFGGKEECFLAAFDALRDHLTELISTAAATEPDWPHQVIAALRAALDFFAAEPDLARLCLLESVSATPAIAIRFREAVLACVPGLALGRAELADPDLVLPETESSIIGGAVSLATRSIITGETEKLPDLLPDLVDFTLSPYLGADRALELAAETRAP
jgi:AcrR family transcriptional regulator